MDMEPVVTAAVIKAAAARTQSFVRLQISSTT